MKKFVITSIEEPDFGCEGRPDGEPVMDRVHLRDEDGGVTVIEAADRMLYQYDLNENDTVVLDEERGLLKVLYQDVTEQKECTSYYVPGCYVMPIGTTVYSMSTAHDNAEYKRYAREYDICFIFDAVPEIDFYTVPQADIFAVDSNGGYFAMVGQMTDLCEGEAPVCYIDKERNCYSIAENGKTFLDRAASWKEHMEPYAGITFFDSRADARKVLKNLYERYI